MSFVIEFGVVLRAFFERIQLNDSKIIGFRRYFFVIISHYSGYAHRFSF